MTFGNALAPILEASSTFLGEFATGVCGPLGIWLPMGRGGVTWSPPAMLGFIMALMACGELGLLREGCGDFSGAGDI